MSSRYERRREREPEPDERIQRPISPGPPRKRPRTDTEPSSSRSVYQRPRSPSPNSHPSTPSYPTAAGHHKPPEKPTPSLNSHQDDRNKLSPSLHKTPQTSFSTQTPTTPPRDHQDTSNHTPAPNAPLKISSALATLSSSTALSSILSRTDGAENPRRATNPISRSPAPAPASTSTLGLSATQFDLAKLHSLSQALQNHGSISVTPTNGNGNGHIPKPAVLATEPRPTHPTAAERSSSSLVCHQNLCSMRPVVDCLRWRRRLTLIGSMSVLCTMKGNLTNDVLQQALARVNDPCIAVDTGRRSLDHIPITLTMGTGRYHTFPGGVLGLQC